MTSLLRVRLGDVTVGLPSMAVREIVRAVAITALPGAPPIAEGAINVRGALVPVIDVRHRLSLPPRALDPDQLLVILTVNDRVLAIRVDDVDELVDVDAASMQPSAALSPALAGLAGLAPGADGVLVMYDPAAFISQAEAAALDGALALHA